MKLLSIIIVTLNCEKKIKKTIESVISQDPNIYELIIIDGSSKDKTVSTFLRYKKFIKYYISEPDLGIYDAMNKGASQAKGKWLIFLNAGDKLAENDTLSRIPFEALKNYTYIFFSFQMKKFRKINYPLPLTKFFMPTSHQATFISRSHMKKNPFNLQYKVASDFDQYLTFIKKGDNLGMILTQDLPITIIEESGFSRINIKLQHREYFKIIRINFGFLSSLIFLVWKNRKFVSLVKKVIGINFFNRLKNSISLAK